MRFGPVIQVRACRSGHTAGFLQHSRGLTNADNVGVHRLRQLFRIGAKHAIRSSRGGPYDIVPQQVFIEKCFQRRRMSKRRNPADRKSGHGANIIRVRLGKFFADKPRHAFDVNHVCSRYQEQNRRFCCFSLKNERFYDLAGHALTGKGCFFSRPCRRRHFDYGRIKTRSEKGLRHFLRAVW